MRTSGMVLAVMAALGMFVVGCGKEEAKKGPEGTNTPAGPAAKKVTTYNEWDAWNSFGEGSSVTYEMSKTDQMTMWQRYTLTKKEADKLTLKVESKMDMKDQPAGEWKAAQGQDPKVITKPKTETAATDAKCAACNKPYKDHKAPDTTESSATEKVGGKDVAVITLKSQMFGCDGAKKGDPSEFKMSKDVPGWMIAMGGPVTEFVKK